MSRLISEYDVMRMLTGVELNNGTITDAKIELRNVKTAYDVEKVVEDILKTKSVYGRIPVSEAIEIVRKGGVE